MTDLRIFNHLDVYKRQNVYTYLVNNNVSTQNCATDVILYNKLSSTPIRLNEYGV